MGVSDFDRGVDWGKFSVGIWNDDDPKTEHALRVVMDVVVDHLSESPDPALIDKMTTAWFNYRCHGSLRAGEVCQTCGTINSGPDV